MSDPKKLKYKAVWFDVYEDLKIRRCFIDNETDKYYDVIEQGRNNQQIPSRISKKDFKDQKWFNSKEEAIEYEDAKCRKDINDLLESAQRAMKLYNLRKPAIDKALKN